MAGAHDPFARIPKTLLDDNRISWRSKGILAYLCGKPDGWKVRVNDIRKHGKEGIRAVYTALKELRKFGYAELTPIREGRRIKEWVWKVSDSAVFKPLLCGNVDGRNVDGKNGHHSKKELTEKDGTENQSKESKESPSGDGGGKSIAAQWKPIAETKEQRRKLLPVPYDFPSEEEFDDFLEDEGLDHIKSGKRENLYRSLCIDKWHVWKKDKWYPIRDWREYVKAIEAKIKEATEKDRTF